LSKSLATVPAPAKPQRSSAPAAVRRRHIARLAPLLPQLGIALRRRRGELPEALKQAGGLGERHIAALVSLAVAGPAAVSELAERIDMTLAHASLVVGELADAGLIEREHDPHDRRRVIVSLSQTAMPAVEQMRNRHAGALIRFLAGLGDEEAERFIDQLTVLVACLRGDDDISTKPGGQP
jgi:DNA-binding MarR family transcriptional regulator